MPILDIRPVVRGQSKAILGIAGVSGSGKTFTALLMARGMVNKASEIGFLDTENGRGSLYADILDGKFLIADLHPPFSPLRYKQAIKEFQEKGVKVLVIDSVSHEWEGEGGCDDIANAPKADGTQRKIANWIGAKREHKGFMNTLLQCNMHVIVCIRAREKTDFKDATHPVSLGLQPICEKNFMFELTASILMENEGKNQRPVKLPLFFKKIFGDGNSYLGIDTGKQILQWIQSGEKEDVEITKMKSELSMACEGGKVGLEAVWNKYTAEQKAKMKPFVNIYVESAKAYDLQKLEAKDENEIGYDDLVTLFELKKPDLTPEKVTDYKRILEGKESKSYAKMQRELMAE